MELRSRATPFPGRGYLAAVSKHQLIAERLAASIALKERVLTDETLLATVYAVAEHCVTALRRDGTVLWCGNGGSAADAQHLSAELTGRFYYDRPPLRSEALHVNTSYLTAVGNDYGYDQVFARVARAQLRKGDVLIGLTTSGRSTNILSALAVARELGAVTVCMTGERQHDLADHVDLLVNVPSADTPRIQEVHMLLGHCICEIVEAQMFPRT